MIKSAIFNSIWDGGICISSNCKVDTDTKEVFDIETAEDTDDLDILECQFVSFDGTDHEVVEESDRENNEQFWYC